MRVVELRFEAQAASLSISPRTILSHGVAELPPNRVDLEARTLETTLPVPRGARTVLITADGKKLHIETVAGSVVPQLAQTVAHMFRLDEDLSDFYALVRDDELSWCATGAGRMLRAPTVFEDVIKTSGPTGSCETAIQQVTIQPAGTTGWHLHPGGTVVVVASGEGTLYHPSGSTCMSEKYAAGTGFYQLPTEVHTFRNEGTVPLVVYALYWLPTGTTNSAIRVDRSAPANCANIS